MLVTFAEMPNASLLPRSLRDLGFSSKQAMHVRPSTDFLTDTNRLANRIGEIIGREVVEYKQLLCDCQRLGLVTFKKSFVEDRSVLEAIDRTGELLVVMNDGRSWVDTNQEMLARRIQSPETSNRFLFLHPSSPFIDILIQKNEKSKTTQLEEIKRSFMSLERNRRPDSNLYIRGHRLFHPYTLILTDSHAFVSTYYYNEGGALPLYKYSKEATDGLYHEFKKDAHRLFERSVDLANTDFT